MRRLITFSSVFAMTLLLGLLLVICQFGSTLTHSSESKANGANNLNCFVSCSSHGQAPGATSSINQENDNDKEPFPPLTLWGQSSLTLSLLYIATFTVIAYIWRKNNIYLEHQLFRL